MIITDHLLKFCAFTVLLGISFNAAAETCGTLPNCPAIGFNIAAANLNTTCKNKTYLKCPFGDYYFCSTVNTCQDYVSNMYRNSIYRTDITSSMLTSVGNSNYLVIDSLDTYTLSAVTNKSGLYLMGSRAFDGPCENVPTLNITNGNLTLMSDSAITGMNFTGSIEMWGPLTLELGEDYSPPNYQTLSKAGITFNIDYLQYNTGSPVIVNAFNGTLKINRVEFPATITTIGLILGNDNTRVVQVSDTSKIFYCLEKDADFSNGEKIASLGPHSYSWDDNYPTVSANGRPGYSFDMSAMNDCVNNYNGVYKIHKNVYYGWCRSSSLSDPNKFQEILAQGDVCIYP